MKQTFFILILSFIAFFFTGAEKWNRNHWRFSLRDQKIVTGNEERLDTTIIIYTGSLKKNDVFSFNLFLCGGNSENLTTHCSLLADGKTYSTSETRGTGISGYMTSKRLHSILDSSGSKDFIFQCHFTGIQTPWQFFRIKIK